MGTDDDLKRWVDAGLIDTPTAASISAYEADRPGTGRIGRGIEAIAYLGAVLVLVALGVLATEFWDRLEPWGRLALAGVVAVVLFAVGLLLGRSEEPALRRAQTFAWFLTIAAVDLTATVLFQYILDVSNDQVILWVAFASVAASLTLWLLRQSVLQMVALGTSAAATLIAAISQVETAPEWAFGLGLAGLGAAWLLLTWGGLLRPARTSYVLASIGILLIAFPEGANLPWPVLGLVAGLGLMALSVPLDESALLGLGVAGLFIYIPMTIFEVFGESLGVPLALLITGLVLLGVVVATIRLRSEAQ
jgi:hypothetical protein